MRGCLLVRPSCLWAGAWLIGSRGLLLRRGGCLVVGGRVALVVCREGGVYLVWGLLMRMLALDHGLCDVSLCGMRQSRAVCCVWRGEVASSHSHALICSLEET